MLLAFLCRVDMDSRWENLKYPIRTPSGRTVEICEPQQLTTGRKEDISSRVARMEDHIFSGEDLSLPADFDLDSWVRRYLIDEISGNIDADITSSYFYGQDGVIYSGPVWDYDMTLGNVSRNQDPQSFMAKNKYASSILMSTYYDALYQNERFQKRLREIYIQEFKPLVNQMLEGGIREEAEHISQASRMNNLRWRAELDSYYARGEINPSDVEALHTYLEARMAFLDEAWIQGKEFCTLQLEFGPNAAFWNLTVEKGTVLGNTSVDTAETIWYDYWTGEIVGPDTVIDRDRILTLQYEAIKVSIQVIVTWLSVVLMAGMMVVLVGADWHLRRKERRKDNERTDSRIPS